MSSIMWRVVSCRTALDDSCQVVEEGSPEMKVLRSIPEGSAGVEKKELEAALGADLVKVCRAWAVFLNSSPWVSGAIVSNFEAARVACAGDDGR